MDKHSKVAAVLVDYDFYVNSEKVRHFVEARQDRASLVALVSEPNALDPFYDGMEWDVVIRNNGGLPDEDFKQRALESLDMYSNLYPAVSIDYFNADMYHDAGVIMALDGGYFG